MKSDKIFETILFFSVTKYSNLIYIKFNESRIYTFSKIGDKSRNCITWNKYRFIMWMMFPTQNMYMADDFLINKNIRNSCIM